MKLYTEEQVKKAIKLAQTSQNYFSTPLVYDEHEVLEKLKPIELPSDEEIYYESILVNQNITIFNFYKGSFQYGAKWMREKIQGGNNEQQVISETASTNTAAGFWVKDLKIQGGISSVAQPIPEEYVVRGQSQPREQMSNNKQSSVEYLIDNLYLKDSLKWEEIIEQAKAMHKKEIEDACKSSITSCGMGHIFIELPEQYYNETYGGKNE